MTSKGIERELVPEQLKDAFARADRAKDLFFDLEKAVKESETLALSQWRIKYDPQTGNYHTRIPDPETMELSRAPKVIVGEIAYNLRCSLDYLIYELAVHNTGRKSKRMRTQFVIVDKPEAFTGQARKYLSKLTTEQIRMVETLQPYRGGWWTALIRDLNSPDKHRHLVDVLTHDANTRVFFGPVETVQEAASKYPGVKVLAEADERGRTICSVSEVVGVYIDGRPAYSVVNHLHMSVCRTLTDFAPQFA